MPSSRLKRIFASVAMAVLVAVMVALPTVANAQQVLDVYEDGYEPLNPVQDNITRLIVNKLDKGTHEHIAGAMLCIIKEETGEVVDTWTSDGTPHEIARNVQGVGKEGALDINTWYILKELKVPEGYSENFKELQDDPKSPCLIRFMLKSDENFNTAGELVIDDKIAEFVEDEQIRGSGPEQAYVITLYNENDAYIEEVEKRTRTHDKVIEDSTEKQDSKTTSNSTSNHEEYEDVVEKSNNETKTKSNSKEDEVEYEDVIEYRNQNQTQSSTQAANSRGGGSLTRTGDETSYVPVVVIAVLGVGLIAFALVRRKKQ